MRKDPRRTYVFKQLLLILSACALFAVNARSLNNMMALPLSAVALFFWTRYDRRLIEHKPVSPIWNIFFAFTALGISLAPVSLFQKTLTDSKVMVQLQSISGLDAMLLSRLICGALVVGALWFAFCAVRYFYELLRPVVREIAADFSRTEYWVLAGISLVFMAAVGVLFVQTNAFAHPFLECDLFYSSDSGACINYQSYFRLGGIENDIRSPLFALFSAPFLGIPYLISLLIPLANAQALVLTMAQVPFHIVSWYLVIRMIPDLKPAQRFSLLALALVSYSGLLFAFFPEQYIFSVFWITLFLYRYVLQNRREDLLLLGSAGTMITSAVFALLPDRDPAKQSIDSRIKAFLATGFKGVSLLFAFGCFDVLMSYQHVSHLIKYTNVVGSFAQKLMQFSVLIGSAFFAANASPVVLTSAINEWNEIANGSMVWRENPVLVFSIAGLIIAALAIAGFVLNRKQLFAKISVLWCAFAFVVICFFGWGTRENGMFLYTKYFGWAFFVLIVFLVQKIASWLHFETRTAPIYWAAAAALFLANLPQLQALLNFALTYYPA